MRLKKLKEMADGKKKKAQLRLKKLRTARAENKRLSSELKALKAENAELKKAATTLDAAALASTSAPPQSKPTHME